MHASLHGLQDPDSGLSRQLSHAATFRLETVFCVCLPRLPAPQVLCGGPQQLAEAQQEVAAHRRLRHPCLLPLLDAGVQQQRTPDGSTRQVVLMLFPGGQRCWMGLWVWSLPWLQSSLPRCPCSYSPPLCATPPNAACCSVCRGQPV
jgi:hypothetical protein